MSEIHVKNSVEQILITIKGNEHLNAASKYIYNLANYYFNGDKDLINSYFSYDVKDVLGHNTLHINTLKDVKRSLEPMPKNVRIHIIGKHIKGHTKHNKEVDKDEQGMLHWENQIRKNVVDKLHDNRDLVIWDDNDGNYHILTRKDFFNIKEILQTFLFVHTTKKWQINWILQHKPISDFKFAQIVNMKPSQITNYRTGKVDINQMPLKNALDIDHYYLLFIGRKLIDIKAPNKSAINDSKNDTPNDLISL